MRSPMTQCARLLAVSMVVAACSQARHAPPPPHNHALVKITDTCSATLAKLVVDSSSVHIHYSNSHVPTDIDWSVDPKSDIDQVTITPDAPAWPLEEPAPPPFVASKNQAYHGVGRQTQASGQYRYSVTMMCNGVRVVFDPDIWVD